MMIFQPVKQDYACVQKMTMILDNILDFQTSWKLSFFLVWVLK